MKLVESAEPFHWTIAFWAKFVPFTVMLKAGPVAMAEAGLSVVSVGGWGVRVKFAVPEIFPPETTATGTVPAPLIRLAGTEAVNCVALTTFVTRDVLFHCTTAPVRKPVPLTVRVNAALYAVAEDGFNEVMAGGGSGLTEKVTGEETPPGDTTVMAGLPAAAISAAVTAAVT